MIPDDAEQLVPVRRWRPRLIFWLCFAAFIAIGGGPLSGKLMLMLLVGLTLGVLPWTAISPQRVTRGWSLFCWTLHVKSWDLRRFASIDVGSEDDDAIPDPTGMLTLILFGGSNLLWPLFGWFLPWAGGPYKLSLRRLSGERIVVWQGSREQHFRENLQTLERLTGFPIGRG